MSTQDKPQRERQLYVMETPYTQCDVCKEDVGTVTIMAGIDRIVSLCEQCWCQFDMQRKVAEPWPTR